ncbi:hypothetical protein BV133_1882 [Blastochloris viridis]|uniref:Uncharacterized protein n=1 Tax=Blastochloris viridis TaxID=1079 RepID=A0A182D227_BLAVI|nr:hypothetical protein BV133_1882 [Blastochloris viridis]
MSVHRRALASAGKTRPGCDMGGLGRQPRRGRGLTGTASAANRIHSPKTFSKGRPRWPKMNSAPSGSARSQGASFTT